MIRLRFGAILLPVAALSAGCESISSAQPAFAVRDSAGIEIVESAVPLLGPDAWIISEEPVLQIGAVEGEDPYLFADIGAFTESIGMVFRLEDGRFVVCNGMDGKVRFFDGEGRFLKQIGGYGEGPGEFDKITGCSPVGDRIAVLNIMKGVSWFDSEGNYLQLDPVEWIDGGITSPIGVFPEGAILLVSNFSTGWDPSPGVHAGAQDLFLQEADGSVGDAFLRMNTSQSVRWSENPRGGGGRQAFTPVGQVEIWNGDVVLGWPTEYQLSLFDRAGRQKKIVRRDWALSPITEEDIRWWEDFHLNGTERLTGREPSPAMRRMSQERVDNMVFPEHHPVFDLIRTDRTGHLWVRQKHPRYNSTYDIYNLPFPHDYRWDVFDPDGRWLTTLTLPNSLDIHEIGEDYILGVWKDDFHVEYVRVYSLDRGR